VTTVRRVLAIEAGGLSKAYAGGLGVSTVALERLDLKVQRGQAVGVIGLNGAGKTTLVKLVLGLALPTSGQLRVLGGSPADPKVRARIGYLPERLGLPGNWSAQTFLVSVAQLKGLSNGAHEARRQLDRVELDPPRFKRIKHFSKGMRQRLALAAALLGAPDLLVLDEPSDGVDPLGRDQIRKLIQEERTRGAAILINSHLLSEVERLCDRIVILYRGRIAKSGSVNQLCGTEGAYRARFSPIAPATLRPFGFLPHADGGFRISVSSVPDLNKKIEQALATGALLEDLRPDLRPLEEVLAEVIAQ
jgi:ABC-2 type transport system ATP-binding protein